jgi:hypothetical protein
VHPSRSPCGFDARALEQRLSQEIAALQADVAGGDWDAVARRAGGLADYSLEGIGTVRLEGLFSSGATAEAGERGWRFTRRGFWQRVTEATEAAGFPARRADGSRSSGDEASSLSRAWVMWTSRQSKRMARSRALPNSRCLRS